MFEKEIKDLLGQHTTYPGVYIPGGYYACGAPGCTEYFEPESAEEFNEMLDAHQAQVVAALLASRTGEEAVGEDGLEHLLMLAFDEEVGESLHGIEWRDVYRATDNQAKALRAAGWVQGREAWRQGFEAGRRKVPPGPPNPPVNPYDPEGVA